MKPKIEKIIYGKVTVEIEFLTDSIQQIHRILERSELVCSEKFQMLEVRPTPYRLDLSSLKEEFMCTECGMTAESERDIEHCSSRCKE